MLCHKTICAAKLVGVPLTTDPDVVEDVELVDVEDTVVDAALSVVGVVVARAVEDPAVAGSLVVPVVLVVPVTDSTALVEELSDGGE